MFSGVLVWNLLRWFLFVLWDLKIGRVGPFFSHIAAGIGVKFIQPRLSWSVPHLLSSVSFRIFSWRWYSATKTLFFFKQVSIKCCLSLNPQPLFLKGCRHPTFFLNPPCFARWFFPPGFSLQKKNDKNPQGPPGGSRSTPPYRLVMRAFCVWPIPWAWAWWRSPSRSGDEWWISGVGERFGGWVWGRWVGVEGEGCTHLTIWNCGVSMVWIACECAIWATKKRSVRSCFFFQRAFKLGWMRTKKSSTKTPSQAALQEMSLQSAAEKCLQQKTKGDKMLPTNTLTKAGFSNIPLKFLTFQWIFPNHKK